MGSYVEIGSHNMALKGNLCLVPRRREDLSDWVGEVWHRSLTISKSGSQCKGLVENARKRLFL